MVLSISCAGCSESASIGAVTMLFWSDVIGRTTARLAHIPRLISSIRARNRQYALWQLLLVRATMPLADAVVLNSRRVAAFAVAGEGVPPDRLIHIPNGVDVSSYETCSTTHSALRSIWRAGGCHDYRQRWAVDIPKRVRCASRCTGSTSTHKCASHRGRRGGRARAPA
jgi:hypothetical protein